MWDRDRCRREGQPWPLMECISGNGDYDPRLIDGPMYDFPCAEIWREHDTQRCDIKLSSFFPHTQNNNNRGGNMGGVVETRESSYKNSLSKRESYNITTNVDIIDNGGSNPRGIYTRRAAKEVERSEKDVRKKVGKK